ncbi:uncharacterized protein K452DRAFT_355176 [Aplosporella prunicola CBS 121167]|uniref:Protein kinase domain-containing protein n=1 Tax=Aplosporella prunicola CBS 121167 TaxID=1176127 RepID=A0A6A6BRJ7_9PEZI|nr:uncharacterized protein K452DRAFT_355176 [Aplosporella prunicola CBS 121167]KAF2146712.1 hypothetical protein K452DRAFT_355176 [Aplosporella prunicola CBS 121167]
MIYPLSIAGIALAIINQVLNLGERTSNIIRELKDFEETWRASAFKALLFEDLPMHEGKTLFEHFDNTAQEQIRLALDDILDAISDASRLMERQLPLSKHISSMLQIPVYTKLRWISHDKRRALSIITRVVDLNTRLRDKLELLLMASTVGGGLQHLKRLQSSPHARELGFQDDDIVFDRESRFTSTCRNGNHVLVENSGPVGESFSALTGHMRHRVEALAGFLHQPKGQSFRIPRCLGWQFVPEKQSVTLVFEAPGNNAMKPISLLEMLRTKSIKPSLRDKFQVAFGLAKSVAQLHMVQWVHESLRSENILFFPKADVEPTSHRSSKSILFEEPWILGFEFSRPDPFFSSGCTDTDMASNVYRHPERQGWHNGVIHLFKKEHDIYALGVVLLEIGLWETALQQDSRKFASVESPAAVQRHLTKVAERRLESRMGPKFQALVLKCLSGDFGVKEDTKEDLHLQEAFRSQVVDVLQRALENV